MDWMKFDPVRFGLLVDGMELDEVGAVAKLIGHLWKLGPMSEADVRRVCRSTYDAVRERMIEAEGLLSFDMIEEARDAANAYQSQRSEAGIISAEKRKKTSTTVERPLNECSSDVLSISLSSSLSCSESDKLKERARDSQFDAFWSAYPEKKGKGAAMKAWDKLKASERSACKDAIEAQMRAHHFRGLDGKDYIPHPATWLNQRRWEDEVRTGPVEKPRPQAIGWMIPERK